MLSLVTFVLYSHWRLSLAVAERRMATLRRLNSAMPRRPPGRPQQFDEETQRVYELFKEVSGSPLGMVNSQTVASVTLSILTGIVPVAIALLVR
ncbi:hypothetical protein [Streptomyces sp. uw30]|uniref:hypothetical protein n=1 Tax=Streptomyces sp. uw30 TaxID=1828179 RepID=UPI0011CD365E|nr:hypothetical protein [Streptomyces sp. uw30]